MIEETAIVVDINGQQVLLETQRQSACQSCSVKSGCGTSTLASVVGKRSSQFVVDNSLELQVGDKVIVAIDENALVQGSLLIYLMPLIFMLLIGVLVETLFANEPLTIASVASGFVVSLFAVRFILSTSSLKKSVQPHLVRQI